MSCNLNNLIEKRAGIDSHSSPVKEDAIKEEVILVDRLASMRIDAVGEQGIPPSDQLVAGQDVDLNIGSISVYTELQSRNIQSTSTAGDVSMEEKPYSNSKLANLSLGKKRRISTEIDDLSSDVFSEKTEDAQIAPWNRLITESFVDLEAKRRRPDEMDVDTPLSSIPVVKSTPMNPQETWANLISQNDAAALDKIKFLIKDKQYSMESIGYYNPLCHAAKKHDADMFDFILEHTDFPQNPLSENALCGVCCYMTGKKRIKRCQQLLDKGWRFNQPSVKSNYSVLEYLVSSGVNFSFIFEHFPKEINVNASDYQGVTFFQLVLKSNKEDMIKKVMKQDQFDPTYRDKDNSTYVTYAFCAGFMDVGYKLLKKYPDAATLHSNKWGTPLQTMSIIYPYSYFAERVRSADYKKIIAYLLKKKVDINQGKPFEMDVDKFVTPIRLSVMSLNIACTQALFDKGVDLSVTSLLNQVALNRPTLGYQYRGSELNDMLVLLGSWVMDSEGYDAKPKDKSSANELMLPHKESDSFLKALAIDKEEAMESEPA